MQNGWVRIFLIAASGLVLFFYFRPDTSENLPKDLVQTAENESVTASNKHTTSMVVAPSASTILDASPTQEPIESLESDPRDEAQRIEKQAQDDILLVKRVEEQRNAFLDKIESELPPHTRAELAGHRADSYRLLAQIQQQLNRTEDPAQRTRLEQELNDVKKTYADVYKGIFGEANWEQLEALTKEFEETKARLFEDSVKTD